MLLDAKIEGNVTPLLYAIEGNQAETVRELIKLGATPVLHVEAIHHGYKDIIEILLNAGASVCLLLILIHFNNCIFALFEISNIDFFFLRY